MSLFRDYLRLLIVVDFVMMKSTGGFPPRRVFRHAGRDVTRFQPRFLRSYARTQRVGNSRRFAERIRRPHFTTPTVWPAVPSPPLVVWLLYTTTYISSQEVTYLCLHVFPPTYYSYRLPYIKPLFIVAAISSLPYVSYPLYLQSPPSAQLHLSVPVPNPQGLNMFHIFRYPRILLPPTRFLRGRVLL
jgi:hypothetical protein